VDQLVRIDWFDEVCIKTGAGDRGPIFGPAVAGDRDQPDRMSVHRRAHAASNFVTVHFWKADIHQGHVRLLAANGFQSAATVGRGADETAVEL